jgi:hypothetical protein
VAAGVTGDSGALVPVQPEGGVPVPQPTDVPAPSHARRHVLQMPHRFRFYAVYGLLAIALGAAAAGVVVFASRSINPAPPWSTWRPSGGGLGAAQQIGAHVAGLYRLPSGRQLVDVIAKAPTVTPQKNLTLPISYIALRGPQGKVDQDIPISSTDSVMFSLCGLGSSCSIATGTPSLARGRLVRREILELALYTFKYASGINNVIAYLPPPAGSAPTYLVYLQKSDLAAELKVPLAETLREKTPLPNTIPASEVQLVDSTTNAHIFSFGFAPSQQGDAILVLDPLPA